MIETTKNSTIGTTVGIRIHGINREKTRKINGLDAKYQVYFELSEAPCQPWRNIFEHEWKRLTPTQPALWQDANIDGRFLVINCSLQDVTNTFLPLLKEVVSATNGAYKRHAQQQASEKETKVTVWKQERKSVDDMADSLNFD